MYLGKIKQEPEFDLENNFTINPKLRSPSENDLSITENPVAYNTCKVEIDYMPNESVKEEFAIKTEDDTTLHNPLFKEELIHVNLMYCYQCNYGTNDKQTLVDHIFTHRTQLFTCHNCDYQTTSKVVLKFHMQTHDNNKLLFQRKECSFSAQSMDSLKNHTLQHENLSTTIKNRFKLLLKNNYVENSDAQKIIKCEKCEFSTTKAIYLNRHVLRMHKYVRVKEKPYKCDSCENRYISLSSFKIHKLKHSGGRFFMCDKCDYRTIRKSSLTKHKIIHSKEKLFKCHSCDYKSYFNSSLISHKRIHSDVKPFKCHLCEYQSDSKKYLILHKAFHSEEK